MKREEIRKRRSQAAVGTGIVQIDEGRIQAHVDEVDKCLGLVENFAEFYPEAKWQRKSAHLRRDRVLKLLPSCCTAADIMDRPAISQVYLYQQGDPLAVVDDFLREQLNIC